jgi:hypothetical protein
MPQSRDRCGHAKLELSDLNREPSMPYVIRVLVAYQNKFHESSSSSTDSDAPLWIPEVSKMLARGQPRNLRLFAIKVLIPWFGCFFCCGRFLLFEEIVILRQCQSLLIYIIFFPFTVAAKRRHSTNGGAVLK